MALKYGFFNSVNGDRKYSADDMTYPYKGIVSDGVVAHPDKSDGFQVVAGTGLQVKVKAGFGLFAGKWCENDSVVNLALSPAHVTLARIDTVYIKVDLSEGGRRIDLLLNTGTPSSSPTAMVFNQTSEAKYFRLADIRVNANAKSISQSNITDKRPSAECGFVTNLLQNSDISATYAQWEQQFSEFMQESEVEYNESSTEFNQAIQEVKESVKNAEQTFQSMGQEVEREFNDFITDSQNSVDQHIESSQREFETFISDSQNRIDTAVRDAGATVDEYEERINQSIENANDTAERLDTDVRQELEQAIEAAEQTVSTLDTEAREQVNQLDTETREQVNQFLADSQNSVDTCISEAEQTVVTLETETREEFNQFLQDSEGKVDQQIETSQQEFDSWFGNVQQTLNQNTLMTGYFQKFIASEDNTAEVPINITAYTSVKDVLQVHINGMLAVPDVDYVVNDFTTITLSKPVDKDTVVMFTVFKTIDGSEAETVVQQVANLSTKVDSLMTGEESNYYTKTDIDNLVENRAETFTFVVDSNEALAEWANNDTSKGQEYTSVLIRKGEWTSTVGVNLTTTGTKVVKGEAGSKLVFDDEGLGLYYDAVPNTADYYMQGVTVQVIDTATSTGGVAFDNCTNLTNCTGTCTSSGRKDATGFNNCTNLTNCTGTATATGIGSGFGFANCTNLTNCTGTGTGGAGIGFGFCTNLTNCTGTGTATGTGSGFGFANCTKTSYCKAGGHCTTSVFASCVAGSVVVADYACDDTPAGGFNDTTNPSA